MGPISGTQLDSTLQIFDTTHWAQGK